MSWPCKGFAEDMHYILHRKYSAQTEHRRVGVPPCLRVRKITRSTMEMYWNISKELSDQGDTVEKSFCFNPMFWS